jgi:hypothetical protein
VQRSRKCRFLAALGLFAFGAGIPEFPQDSPDFTQADAMITFLRSCAAGKTSGQELNRVLSSPGTNLVVQQQNISRRVTREQYRTILEAACAGKAAVVKPSEAGERAKRGVQGLTEDVGPSLLWGRNHVPDLVGLLAELRGSQVMSGVLPLTRKYLPESTPLQPKFYVVMGGRAGAAAIEDNLYYDILSSAWRASQGRSQPVSPDAVLEFFSHEAHHLGYGQILDKERASLPMTPAEGQAWRFLTAVMMEGSATFLINGRERLTKVQQMPGFQEYAVKVPALLPAMQEILRQALAGPLSDEEYDRASSEFLGMGYHAAGAQLLNVIYAKQGLKGVMQVMGDPRRLLTTYNHCATGKATFRFDPELSARVAHVGDSEAR